MAQNGAMSEPAASSPGPRAVPGTDQAHPTRVAVVGTGAVGSTFAFSLLLGGLAAEIVLIDANARKAEGEAMDLMHAVPFARTDADLGRHPSTTAPARPSR